MEERERKRERQGESGEQGIADGHFYMGEETAAFCEKFPKLRPLVLLIGAV
jgi:hypothetical protein